MGRKAATKATPEKEANNIAMALFLAALMDGSTVTVSAEQASVDRATVYRWREKDVEFAKAWDEALEAGTDRLEQEALRRARDGVAKPVYQGGKQVGQVQEYSDTLMIFLLKSRRPDKFRDRVSAELTGKDGKDLPAPGPVPAGVLIVPGLMTDTAAWSEMAQRASMRPGE